MDKIEKLERVKPEQLTGMIGEVSPQWVAKELNKIIDYLNQFQKEPEEKLKEEDMLRWLRNGGVLKIEEEKQNKKEETDLRNEILRIFAEEEISLLLADSLQDKLVDYISKLLKEKE